MNNNTTNKKQYIQFMRKAWVIIILCNPIIYNSLKYKDYSFDKSNLISDI
jgi:hypothetical protein